MLDLDYIFDPDRLVREVTLPDMPSQQVADLPATLRAVPATRREGPTVVPKLSIWARRASGLLSSVADTDIRADLRELFEHRAGVTEFDGNLSRAKAEKLAYQELLAAFRAKEKQSKDDWFSC